MEETKDDIILAKMGRSERICIRCKHYVEHRIPERVAKYGKNTGYCVNPIDDHVDDHVDDCRSTITVNADSTCDLYEPLHSI